MAGPVVLVLRADDSFSAKLRESGCQVIALPLIDLLPVEDKSEIDDVIARISEFDGLFFTSPYAAEIFLARLEGADETLDIAIYVLGERAKRVFDNAGINVHYKSEANTAAEMIASFGEDEFAGKRLLFVRGDKSMRTIPDLLSGKATIDELIVYRTVDNLPNAGVVEDIRHRLAGGEIDWLCFFSPSGVDAFRKLFDKAAAGIKTAAIGKTTADAAQNAGFYVQLISNRPNADEFAAELIQRIKQID